MHVVASALAKSSYKVRVITMHNVVELAEKNALDWVRAFDIAFVHSAKDAALLSAAGYPNPVVVPHGIARAKTEVTGTRAPGTYTVGTFGFLFPHKNVEKLVAAVAIARDYVPNIRLKLLNSVDASESSLLARAKVETLIEYHEMQDRVSARFDFMDEEDVISELAACDLIAFVYGPSTESATGAARIGLMADRPLLCSTSAVLADLHPIAHVLSKIDPVTIAEALISLCSNRELLEMYDEERRKLVEAYSFERAAIRYTAHIEDLLLSRSYDH
jgi:hypothetical protein